MVPSLALVVSASMLARVRNETPDRVASRSRDQFNKARAALICAAVKVACFMQIVFDTPMFIIAQFMQLSKTVRSGSMKTMEVLDNVSNDGAKAISDEEPYVAEVRVKGAAAMLFHRWSCEDVKIKADAKKGSKTKKEDNVQSYVWRNAQNEICIPGEYFRMSIINAAKFLQDPRSPRKSAMDLFKAGIATLDELCSLGTKEWDYLDQRRVTIQRNGITRIRPAFNVGWECEFRIQVLLPEYISPELLNETIQKAGRLIGVGDFRPTFGRFQIVKFEAIQ